MAMTILVGVLLQDQPTQGGIKAMLQSKLEGIRHIPETITHRVMNIERGVAKLTDLSKLRISRTRAADSDEPGPRPLETTGPCPPKPFTTEKKGESAASTHSRSKRTGSSSSTGEAGDRHAAVHTWVSIQTNQLGPEFTGPWTH